MTSHALETRMAHAIRSLAMDGVEKAKSGHPGLPMGAADIATVIYTKFLKFDPSDPHWADRDRFILSAGHGSMLLYALLYLTGTPGMTMDELKSFRQWGSKTPGHPEVGHRWRDLRVHRDVPGLRQDGPRRGLRRGCRVARDAGTRREVARWPLRAGPRVPLLTTVRPGCRAGVTLPGAVRP